MLNYIKLVKQIRHDFLCKDLKDYYKEGDLTARRVLEYEIDGTFLEDTVYHNILYEVTNDKE